MRTRLTIVTLLAAAALSQPALAAGDTDAGQRVFHAKCALCHPAAPGLVKVGPNLFGVYGRKAGALPDYVYSDANRTSSVVWDATTLDAYLTDPRGNMPGARMIFPGLKSAYDRANVIAYLATLK